MFTSRRLPSIAAVLVLTLLMAAPSAAQSPSAEGMAAARELVTTMRLSDQLKALMPMIMNSMKTAMLAGRSPEFVRDFEAFVPKLMAEFDSRTGEFTDVLATVYAANFTAQELRDMTAFYRTPTGQKMLERLPTVMQQSMQLGQTYGKKIGDEVMQRMIEELRKKGHNI